MSEVSICIPCYNNESSVKVLLDSIKNQDYVNYEVIISDDSEGDSIEKLVRGYDCIQYYHNTERLGATANCNHAISKAKGKYIKIMHHDDWFADKTSLGKMVGLLEDNPWAMLAFCGTIQVGEKKRYSRHISEEDAEMYRKNYKTVFLRNKIGAPSAMIFRNLNFYFDPNLMWLVDMELYLRILERNDSIVYVEEPYICIGMGKGQLTNVCMEDIVLQRKEYSYVYTKHNLRADKACRDFYVKKMISLGAGRKELKKNDVSFFTYLIYVIYSRLLAKLKIRIK